MQDFDTDTVQERQPGLEHEMAEAPDWRPRYPGSGRLAGKVALITGGDSGIGRATAVLFAREGAKVAIVYLDETRDAEETAAAVRDEGSEALLIAGDVGARDFCRDAVARTLDAFGRLDVLVNGAAEQHARADVTDIPEAQIEQTFRTNIFGQMFMVQEALPHLGAGAAIVNVTSVTAYRGQDLLVDYAATKGAILAFTRALAGKLAGRGIRVNGVAPGPIWTPLIPASFSQEQVADFGKSTPLGRPGEPAEVAPSLLFLACDDASYMTGQVLHPNGGEPVGG